MEFLSRSQMSCLSQSRSRAAAKSGGHRESAMGHGITTQTRRTLMRRVRPGQVAQITPSRGSVR
jgi:hypothetical protein